MIVPLVNEPEWIESLRTLATWNPPPNPLLVVAPHPDDETLGAGGLIASHCLQSFNVSVAAVTDGEHAYKDFPDLAQIRRVEQAAALAHLGVQPANIIRFGMPDSNVASVEQALVERLRPLISGATHVVAPWTGDFHPDHQACGRAAQRVAQEAGALLTFYFFWTWHFGNPALLSELSLRSFPLNRQTLSAKASALLCHRSQLEHHDDEPVLPESLLAPARRPFETFALA